MSDHTTTEQAPPSPRSDDGVVTAEYAVATVASCGFAGVLYTIIQSDTVQKLLLNVIKHAFSFLF